MSFCHPPDISWRNYGFPSGHPRIGHVVDVLPNGMLLIDFEGASVEIEKGSPNLQDIHLAYALTIHKTQRSEFPCAVVVVHKAHSFMHHRNLLYTGVTRARKTAIILGDRWGIRNCAKKGLFVLFKKMERNVFLSSTISTTPIAPKIRTSATLSFSLSGDNAR
jgi:hypothetical protein